MTEEFLRYLEVAGVWGAAFATYFAAKTAIRIAAQQNEIRLKAHVTTSVRISPNGAKTNNIWIQVTNLGTRAATITDISWKVWAFRSQWLLQTFDDPLSARLPSELRDGQTANFFINEHDSGSGWFRYFARVAIVDGRNCMSRAIAQSTLKLYVTVSNGKSFICKPSGIFIRKLRAAVSDEMRYQLRNSSGV